MIQEVTKKGDSSDGTVTLPQLVAACNKNTTTIVKAFDLIEKRLQVLTVWNLVISVSYVVLAGILFVKGIL